MEVAVDAARLRGNIGLLYAFRALHSIGISVPILVPFMQANGLNQTGIFMLQSIYAMTIVLCEVPSGYIADQWGRKPCLVLGSMLWCGGLLLFTLGVGFWPLALGQVIIGLAGSCVSGADSALAFDSLAALGEERAVTYEARGLGWAGFSEAGGSLIGGSLVLIDLRAALIAHTIASLPMIFLALRLVEPPHSRPTTFHPIRDILRVTAYALHGHAEIKWLILYPAIILTFTYTMVWLTQPYYQQVGLPLGWFGVVWSMQLLAVGVFAQFADRYQRLLGRRAAFASILGVGIVCYVVLGAWHSLWALPVILGFYFMRGMVSPIAKGHLNRMIESEVRATILSVQSLVERMMYVVAGPIVGLVADHGSLSIAMWFAAGVYGSAGLIVLGMMRRVSAL